MERTEPTTRARDEDDPTLAALERILLIEQQGLDPDNPEDYDLYCHSRDLLEHVRETLENVRLIHEREAQG